MAGAQDGLGLGPSIERTEASDVLAYVTDVAVSIGSLLQASSSICAGGGGRAAAAAAGGAEGAGGNGGDGGGGGDIAQLALRFQGADGDVPPEGLAAALALTFEATLPALEGLLLTAPASTAGEVREGRVPLRLSFRVGATPYRRLRM